VRESADRPGVVLVHGAWADGSSWNDVIGPLLAWGLNVLAAPVPLTSLSDDTAALDRALERTSGPVILVAHAYAGAVIGATTNERVQALVFIAALARLTKAKQSPTTTQLPNALRFLQRPSDQSPSRAFRRKRRAPVGK
jgi:pimeloyl-ACP methyl ester carboxylesterase